MEEKELKEEVVEEATEEAEVVEEGVFVQEEPETPQEVQPEEATEE